MMHPKPTDSRHFRDMFKVKTLLLVIAAGALMFSCNRDVTSFADIHFDLLYDEDQVRLDNLGNPSEVPAGHAAQTPDMQVMSVHYIELTSNEFVQLGDGEVLYMAPETSIGGENAILFDSSILAEERADFMQLRLERLPAGTYKYLRASLAYQQYQVQFDLHNVPVYGTLPGCTGILGSFVGFRTYIDDLNLGGMTTSINANKEQGFWGFATTFTDALAPYNTIYTGQAPEGATTVVNPLNATSPIPAGSCVVTGMFTEPLVVTGDETQDLYIHISFSTNNSFEWIDSDTDGIWDIDAVDAGATEQVTDMGVRGMIPTWEWRD